MWTMRPSARTLRPPARPPFCERSRPVALEPVSDPGARATFWLWSHPPEPLAGATRRSHALAPEPPVRATRQNHLGEPEPLTRATRQSHLVESEPVAGATVESQSEPVAGTTEERLQAAYQVLAAEGGRVSGRALAARARCNRAVATEWLQRRQRGAEVEPEPLAGATLASQSEPVEVSA